MILFFNMKSIFKKPIIFEQEVVDSNYYNSWNNKYFKVICVSIYLKVFIIFLGHFISEIYIYFTYLAIKSTHDCVSIDNYLYEHDILLE